MKMKHFITLSLILAGTLATFPTKAQESVWTLQTCIDQALKQNIQIKQSELNIQVSSINTAQARSNRFPSVDGSVRQSFGWSNQTDVATGSDSFKGSSNSSASASSSVVLYNGKKLTNSIKQAQLDYEAGKLDLEALKETISLSVMDAYLQILYAQEQVSNSKHQIEVTEKELQLAGERLALSVISRADYLQIQSQLADEKLTLANAESLLEMNRVALMQLLEEPLNEGFRIAEPDLSLLVNRKLTPNPDSVYRIALAIKPQIKSYTLKKESIAIGIDLAKADYYPRLTMDAGLSTGYYSLTQSSAFAQQLGNNINPTTGLTLSVPIYSNNKIKNQVQIARINTSSAELDLKNTMNQLRKSVEQACTDVSSAQKEFEASVEQYQSNVESYAVSTEKFNQGMINSVDYLYQKTNLITAESALLQSRFNLVFSYKLLDFYTGKPLSL
ncbi:MAG: TolC family protein [Bacteroidales bacterium]|nr:TolC family protein [Bacteroidales bacterium]